MAWTITGRGFTKSSSFTNGDVADTFTPSEDDIVIVITEVGQFGNNAGLGGVTGFGATWVEIALDTSQSSKFQAWAARMPSSPGSDRVNIDLDIGASPIGQTSAVFQISGASTTATVGVGSGQLFPQVGITSVYDPNSPIALTNLSAFESSSNLSLTLSSVSADSAFSAKAGWSEAEQSSGSPTRANIAAFYLDSEDVSHVVTSTTDFDFDVVNAFAIEVAEAGGGDPTPSITSITDPVTTGGTVVFTGTGFESPQGTGNTTQEGISLTESPWADLEVTATSITIESTIAKYGTNTFGLTNNFGNSDSIPSTVNPISTMSFVDLGTLAVTGDRITAVGTLAPGDQLVYENFLYQGVTGFPEFPVVINTDGTFTITGGPVPNGTYEFSVKAWESSGLLWGGVADQTVTFDASTHGSGSAEAQESTVTSTAEVDTIGSGSVQAQPSIVSGSGNALTFGSGDAQAQDSVVSSAGLILIQGSGDAQAQESTTSGLSGSLVTGEGFPQAQSSTVSGPGLVLVTGSGSADAQSSTTDGEGESADIVAGDGDAAAQPSTTEGVGVVPTRGSGSAEAQDSQVVGAGSLPTDGSGAATAQASQVNGVGALATKGSGAAQAQASITEGFGGEVIPIFGSGGAVSQASQTKGTEMAITPPAIEGATFGVLNVIDATGSGAYAIIKDSGLGLKSKIG